MTHAHLTWPARAGLLAVLVLFCAPLFIGLRGWDLRNDEAIYSYAVDRVIETGEWLTPRSSPGDGPFFEKPPLKIWLVAAGIKLGLLPFDERGMRLWDVVFASAAFVYVFLLGCRLAGTAAGFVSVFLMFAFDPLIFEHGVRGNNMDAPLLVAYSGGIYHFVRWADGGATLVRRLHALAIGAFFSLGFMTKFVAILFLPAVCAVAFALTPLAVARARETWKDWVIPAAFVVIACTPWFVYQTIVNGHTFWDNIFLAHVYTRFTGTLVVEHIRPWHHYVSQLWLELEYARMAWIVLAGFVLLVLRAVWQRDWLARTCLVWFLLPLALLSMGTSKLFYYLYPFVPPLALGGGLVAATIVDLIDSRFVRSLAERAATVVKVRGAPLPPRARRLIAVIGGLALLLGAWTFCFGTVTLEVAGVRLFRNSSPARALAIGSVAWLASGYGAWNMKPLAAAVIALLLPVGTYVPRVERFSSIDHPLQSVRDCALAVQASGASPATGVLHVSGDLHHAFNYYLRRLGRWVGADAARPDELRRRLSMPGEHSPVVMSKESYLALADGGGEEGPAGISIGDTFFILLPGPYEACVPAAVAGGGEDLRRPRAPFAAPGSGRKNL